MARCPSIFSYGLRNLDKISDVAMRVAGQAGLMGMVILLTKVGLGFILGWLSEFPLADAIICVG